MPSRPTYQALVLAFFAFLSAPGVADTGQTCAPEGLNKQALLDLKASGFEIADDVRRNTLATQLTGCLGDPDPAIRDGVVYEGLTAWLRSNLLSATTTESLLDISLSRLAGKGDPEGFEKPFAALLLSEVARTDRIEPWMTPEQREDVVAAAANYLSGVTDYRGFSETAGWRHGVAHGSDLVLQLALNDAINAEALKALLDAIAVQINPQETHFYIYGEPGRLARAVFYIWRRGLVDDEYWSQWFSGIAQPAPLETWGDVFSSQAGLAKRHNTLDFLKSLHLSAVFADEQALADHVITAITAILGG